LKVDAHLEISPDEESTRHDGLTISVILIYAEQDSVRARALLSERSGFSRCGGNLQWVWKLQVDGRIRLSNYLATRYKKHDTVL
jgi:hypothetical protein